MRSKLFTRSKLTEESDFKKDLTELVELPPATLEQLPRHVMAVYLTRSTRERVTAQDAAAEELQVIVSRLVRPIRLGEFFLKEFLSTGNAAEDTPSNLVTDLLEEKLISAYQRDALERFLARLKEHVTEQIEAATRERKTVRTGAPFLTAIATVADFRLVFQDYFHVDTKLETYDPKLLGIVPVALVNLEFDEGPTKEVFFQLDPRALRLLINHLRAAEKELERGEKYLSLSVTPQERSERKGSKS